MLRKEARYLTRNISITDPMQYVNNLEDVVNRMFSEVEPHSRNPRLLIKQKTRTREQYDLDLSDDEVYTKRLRARWRRW